MLWLIEYWIEIPLHLEKKKNNEVKFIFFFFFQMNKAKFYEQYIEKKIDIAQAIGLISTVLSYCCWQLHMSMFSHCE